MAFKQFAALQGRDLHTTHKTHNGLIVHPFIPTFHSKAMYSIRLLQSLTFGNVFC